MNVPASLERTPLWMAAKGRSYDLVKALIDAGADVNFIPSYCPTAMLTASNNPFQAALKMVNLLIKAGADVNMTDNADWTSLMYATLRKSPEVMRALIDAGADVNARNINDDCALTQAAMRSFDEGVEILLEAAGKTDPTRSYLPPLSDIEFKVGQLKITTLRLLLLVGIKINVRNVYYTNTLTYYISQCERNFDQPNKDICMLLFSAGETVAGPVEGERIVVRRGTDVIKAEVPEYLLHKDLQMCLKHLCREAIRKHLLELDPHTHLFGRVPRLGLPTIITEYLLFNMSIEKENSEVLSDSESDENI